jgi:hypothetical protein
MSTSVIWVVDLLHEPVVFLNILALNCLTLHIDKANEARFEVEPLDVVLTSFWVFENSVDKPFKSLYHHDCHPFTVKDILE